ncbi:MAG: cytochrome c oxidase subunit 3 [Candidatus Acidiferrales bacterium]|jgi:cytochrome c oxidase subunit 3|nr:cytochrome c oxidase subunit 3 [Candidatus Acidoferrales bacterium]HXT72724.1 cytochrome c oxidase subunit 3 [Candidatus Angelobacter sp.]
MDVDAVAGQAWGGGVAPFATNTKKLGMWLFLLSDSLTFSTAILAYAYVRLSSANWPRPFEIYPAIANATFLTFILLSSSLTMVMAVAAAHRNEIKKAVIYILLTAVGGVAFVGLHMMEWFRLFAEGVTPWSNKWGDPLFGGTFFGLTGLHMLHVSIGVIYLCIIALGFGRRKFNADHVEVSGLYWHFVDLVWMFIFPMVYLMSVNLKG